MYGQTQTLILRCAGMSQCYILPQPFFAVFGEQRCISTIIRKASTSPSGFPPRKQPFGVKNLRRDEAAKSSALLWPISHQHNSKLSVASSGITSYQQKELTKPNEDHAHHIPNTRSKTAAMEMVKGQLADMVFDIHKELDAELLSDSELAQLAKYYFDGKGKAIRPVIALTLGHAFNQHFATLDDINVRSVEFQELQRKQRQVSIISEMIHTASLVHDDVLAKQILEEGKQLLTKDGTLFDLQ